MLFVYGAWMPLRVLEEIRFWKMQEKEHTVVIRELVPQLEGQYTDKLKQWEAAFAQTEMQAQRWIETVIRSGGYATPAQWEQTRTLMQNAVAESKAFIQLLFYMLSESQAVKQVPTAPVVLMHIIRESEYFLGVMQAILTLPPGTQQQLASPPTAAPQPYTPGVPLTPAPPPAPAASQSAHARPLPPGLTSTGEGVWSGGTVTDSRGVPIGGHTLPPLPYNYQALEPYIDEKTMRIHHDIHHKSYVDGLNQAERKLAESRDTGNFDLIKHWERELAFNGAGHYLHTLFWSVMSPKGGKEPKGDLARQLEGDFGSFEAFKKMFSAAAEKVEGGGWAILVWSPRSGRLEILQAEKHQNGSQWDVIPLLPLDVWEHAYYLKYQNKRPDYVQAWWNVVHWPYVGERFQAARQLKWQPY